MNLLPTLPAVPEPPRYANTRASANANAYVTRGVIPKRIVLHANASAGAKAKANASANGNTGVHITHTNTGSKSLPTARFLIP